MPLNWIFYDGTSWSELAMILKARPDLFIELIAVKDLGFIKESLSSPNRYTHADMVECEVDHTLFNGIPVVPILELKKLYKHNKLGERYYAT